MRIRTIKPDFFRDEKLCQQSHTARLLFVGLWILADKNGCLKNSPQRIAADLFPYEEFYTLEGLDDLVLSTAMGLRYENDGPSKDRHSENDATSSDRHSENDGPSKVLQKNFIRPSVHIQTLLDELQKGGFIELYTDKNGAPSIHIKKFTTHQKLTSWERTEGKNSVEPPDYVISKMTGRQSENDGPSKDRHSENDATSSDRHSEYTEITERTEVAEGAESNLRLQISRFKNSHPDCARVPEAVVANLIQAFPAADFDEALNAFQQDFAGSVITGNYTPQKQFRKYLEKSHRELTGQSVPRGQSSGSDEPEDLDLKVVKAMKDKQRREQAAKRKPA